MNLLGKLPCRCRYVTAYVTLDGRPYRRYPYVVVDTWTAGGSVGEVSKIRQVDSELHIIGAGGIVQTIDLEPISMCGAQRAAQDVEASA